jgi:hypothetical protein
MNIFLLLFNEHFTEIGCRKRAESIGRQFGLATSQEIGPAVFGSVDGLDSFIRSHHNTMRRGH